jgi:hypothetical protein
MRAKWNRPPLTCGALAKPYLACTNLSQQFGYDASGPRWAAATGQSLAMDIGLPLRSVTTIHAFERGVEVDLLHDPS